MAGPPERATKSHAARSASVLGPAVGGQRRVVRVRPQRLVGDPSKLLEHTVDLHEDAPAAPHGIGVVGCMNVVTFKRDGICNLGWYGPNADIDVEGMQSAKYSW